MEPRRDIVHGGKEGAGADLGADSADRLVQVGDLHRAADSVGEALKSYLAARRAIGAGPERVDEALEVELRIADCYLVRGDLSAARRSLGEARALADRTGSGSVRERLAGYEGILAGLAGEYSACVGGCRQAIAALTAHADPVDVPFRGRLHLHLGAALERLGKTEDAGSAFESALEIYRSVSDARGIAHAYNNLGLNCKQRHRYPEAIRYYERALAVLDEVGDYGRKAPTCLNLGLVHLRLGRWGDARVQLDRALQIAREVDNRGRVARALLALGTLDLRERDAASARARFEEAETLALRHGFRRERTLSREFIGELLVTTGHASQGLALLETALREAEAIAPGADLSCEILRRQAEAYLALGELRVAEETAVAAAAAADRIGDRLEAAAARRVIGVSRVRRGEEEAGRSEVRAALNVFERLGVGYEVGLTHLWLARARLETSGDRARDPDIDQSLDAAQEAFSRLEVPGHLADVLLAATEDRIRTLALGDADTLLHRAARYVAASDEHALLEQQNRLKSRLDELHRRAEIEPTLGTAGRDLAQLFAEDVSIESASDALLDIVLRQTSSDRVLFARGLDGSSLGVVASRGFEARERSALLSRLSPLVRICLDRGMPIVRRPEEVGLDTTRISGLAIAPLRVAGEAWGVLYVDRSRRSVVGPYRPADLKLIDLLAEIASISVLALDRTRSAAPLDAAVANEAIAALSRPIIYESRAMADLLTIARKVSASPASVLLAGETGTGKGLLARAIHELGPRRDRPFVAINCAALPETLLESELFGHVTGAFTGAIRTKRGLFEEAEGGTIFLDEVDKTAKTVQAKLLHVLDHQEIRPVGANQWRRVDARVVSATNADLRALIRGGAFLEDLYYRLNDISLVVPPLRDRREDIAPLLVHFGRRFAREMGARRIRFSTEAVERLQCLPWQGNVRELEKVVRGIVTMAEGPEIGPGDLPRELLDEAVNGSAPQTLREAVHALERDLIGRALTDAGGNKSEAARRLRVSYPTLLSKIRAFGLESASHAPRA